MLRSFLFPVLASSVISVAVTLTAVHWALPRTSQAATNDPVSPVVRAQRFELVDVQGSVRGGLALVDDMAVLGLSDPNGVQTLALGVDHNGAALEIGHNGEGYSHALLTVQAGGRPSLVLRDDQGVGSVIGVVPDGTTGLASVDATGKVRGVFGVGQDGSPIISLLDSTGGPVWSAP